MKKLKLEELNRLSPEAYAKAEKLPICIILDDVRSLNNVGAVFRTADAFRTAHIYLCGITGTPPHREIHKTALGATDSVPWSYHEDCTQLVHQLKENGYKVIAVEQAQGSTNLKEFKIPTSEKFALIFGNEVNGINQKVVDHADLCLEIPQSGTKHSLNISVSIGIVIWEFYKSLNFSSL